MRSPRRSASSMWCVLMITVRPSLSLSRRSQMERRAWGSTPAVGSSNSTVRLPPTKARDTDSLRRRPPESCPGNWCLLCSRDRSRRKASASRAASFAPRPLSRPKNHRCSATVRSSKRTLCCGQVPRLRRIASISLRTSRPQMKAVPLVGGYSPVRIDMVVVFPAPLCPRKEVIWPW
uniref:Secreted protein n=1 Tax=Ixodes ricinus TaxID=34613 RepID=A0A6B0UZA4_IXORI